MLLPEICWVVFEFCPLVSVVRDYSLVCNQWHQVACSKQFINNASEQQFLSIFIEEDDKKFDFYYNSLLSKYNVHNLTIVYYRLYDDKIYEIPEYMYEVKNIRFLGNFEQTMFNPSVCLNRDGLESISGAVLFIRAKQTNMKNLVCCERFLTSSEYQKLPEDCVIHYSEMWTDVVTENFDHRVQSIDYNCHAHITVQSSLFNCFTGLKSIELYRCSIHGHSLVCPMLENLVMWKWKCLPQRIESVKLKTLILFTSNPTFEELPLPAVLGPVEHLEINIESCPDNKIIQWTTDVHDWANQFKRTLQFTHLVIKNEEQ
jgi:hypothetical protein